MAEFNDAISSFGPDAGLSCDLFMYAILFERYSVEFTHLFNHSSDFDCNSDQGALFGLTDPGIIDFLQVDNAEFQDDISSYQCFT